MTILQEILKWTQGLPAWQSDAIARLFTKQSLTPADLEDLLALLKAEHGIPDSKGRSANRLTAQQIPSATPSNVHIEILAMKNLRQVNAIAKDQRLGFGAKGITVIYGDNGSGKSGYSRVLKRACRARDQNEVIHPDARLAQGKVGEAEAVFELSINGAPTEVKWINNQPSPEELSSLAIFDARCARAYLDKEDDFSYVPYGLDILEELAKVCKQLEESIKKEQTQNAVDLTIFDKTGGLSTQVRVLLSSLSAKTRPAKVEELATLDDKETARHAQLKVILNTENPKQKAAHLRLRSARISKVSKASIDQTGLTDLSVVAKLQMLANAQKVAKDAADLATKSFKTDMSLLPGTGGEAWKELFKAARKFCVEAHPTKAFPNLGSDGKCPLCQQPLGDGAARLIRFDQFVQAEAEKNAQACREAFENERRLFDSHNITLGLDDELFSEIEELDKPLANATREFEKALKEKYKTIKEACASAEWSQITSIPDSPATQLQALGDGLVQEAIDLEKVEDSTGRAEMEAEYNELDARLALGTVKAAVLSAIGKLDLLAKLKNCFSAVRTTAISNKAKELSEKVISTDLAIALNTEFKSLGAGNLQVSLQSHSEKGKTLHKLKLELPRSANLSDILSEGEQRAIAIGSFLAEVTMSGGKSGIVFDDPVSSLDHKRRESVATRFVQEARARQVIVFTHDIYFLCLVKDEASRLGIPCLAQSLSRRPEGFGVAEPELPFEGKHTKDRIGMLKASHQQIAKLQKEGNDHEHRKQTVEAYRKLRNAWERAVEEVLFANVVLRFRKGIETKRLETVVVNDADHSLINDAMTKCSNYTHDQALLGGTAIPDPEELLADINALDAWRKQVIDRGEHVKQQRKPGK